MRGRLWCNAAAPLILQSRPGRQVGHSEGCNYKRLNQQTALRKCVCVCVGVCVCLVWSVWERGSKWTCVFMYITLRSIKCISVYVCVLIMLCVHSQSECMSVCLCLRIFTHLKHAQQHAHCIINKTRLVTLFPHSSSLPSHWFLYCVRLCVSSTDTSGV